LAESRRNREGHQLGYSRDLYDARTVPTPAEMWVSNNIARYYCVLDLHSSPIRDTATETKTNFVLPNRAV